MIRVRQVKVEVSRNTEENIIKAIQKKYTINNIKRYKIHKQSLDARNKNEIYYSYEIDIEIDNEEKILKKYNNNQDILKTPNEEYHFNITGQEKISNNIVIVGAGPAGLFTAYILAENGYKPIVIERGEDVDSRLETINKFWKENKLNENSNIQFGEGGAGTFSDGKLNTLVKDENNRAKKVLETFVKFGAPEEILYSYKPHIGTDILINVVKNMREYIKKLGGKVLFNSCLTDINISNNKVISIEINNNKTIICDALVLAIGHSARDTFELLHNKNIEMQSKPFAVGIRVQHPQDMINISQYGEKYANSLGSASYKLTYQSSNGHGVYSFCMCPGGYVVNASSEKNKIAINGMSNHDRGSKNANSAIIVTINNEIYGNDLFDGIKFQKELEKKAYELGSGFIPIQLLGDYQKNIITQNFGDVIPIFKGETKFANLNELLPEELNIALKEAFPYFETKIKGFNRPDAILAGIESRTSSPIRILRDKNFESNIKGIYPSGEGAGYAGGITTSAVDGIKVAEAIAKVYKI